MSDAFGNDQVLGAYLKDLAESQLFQAQVALEERMIESGITKLQNLSLKSERLELEYIFQRSMIDSIRQLQNMRSNLIDLGKKQSRDPASKEK